MATLRILSLRGLDPSVKQRIRQALNSTNNGETTDDNSNATLRELVRGESKWHTVRTTVDGITFDSKREADLTPSGSSNCLPERSANLNYKSDSP
jgi:hypothetical protein